MVNGVCSGGRGVAAVASGVFGCGWIAAAVVNGVCGGGFGVVIAHIFKLY